ncbi:FAD/NAD(P)-binding domain-containing protein [Cadophora sp. DSE1049]|nr:FAD/NAD(P)-binding domain-containing protein [Cadophora sp. DSE1049]
MPPFNIAIIGAGPSGCMLARLLLQYQSQTSTPTTTSTPPLAITIFESETSPNFRAQGGTLDLHPSTGLAAIKAAGLYPDFLKYARFDGSAMRITDKNLKTYFSLSASSDGNPEIDRFQLRTLLLDALPEGEGSVTWGFKLDAVEEGGGGKGKLKLKFANGQVREGFDLVVGADGGWSRTRRYLDPLQKPVFSGISKYALTIPDSANTAPEASKLVNRGSLFAFGDGKSISGQQLGEGGIDVGLFVQFDDGEPPKEPLGKRELEDMFGDWSPELRDVIDKAEVEMKVYNLHYLPEGYRWEHRKGVTVLGDAAHLMTPFAGEGVNIAFDDAMKLSCAIIGGVEKGGEALDGNINAFEEDMFVRAAHAQHMTYGMMGDMFFTQGAPRSSMQSWLVRRVSFDIREKWWAPAVYPVLWAVFYGGYAVLRVFY